MLSKSTINKFDIKIEDEERKYGEELKVLEEEYLKKRGKALNKKNKAVSIIEKEKREELMRETRVSCLKKQAYNNYVIGFSGMKKEELIEVVENRVINERLVGLQDDLFMNIMNNYLEKEEKNNMRIVCRTLKKRIKYEKVDSIRNEKELNKRIEKLGEVPSNHMGKEMRCLNTYFKKNKKMESDTKKIVKITKILLDMNSESNIKREKEMIVLSMLDFITQRREFIIKNQVFKRTVINKLDELSINERNRNLKKQLGIFKQRVLDIE